MRVGSNIEMHEGGSANVFFCERDGITVGRGTTQDLMAERTMTIEFV